MQCNRLVMTLPAQHASQVTFQEHFLSQALRGLHRIKAPGAAAWRAEFAPKSGRWHCSQNKPDSHIACGRMYIAPVALCDASPSS